MPLVSVIIPTYNAAQYLTAAVDSVLTQTFQDFEILVIDDGSTDETQMVMRHYGPPVAYFHQQNRGVAVARNRGIEESRGRYIAFLDADDTWLPHKLERQLLMLDGHTSYRASYTAHLVADVNLTPHAVRRSHRHGSALEDLLTRGNVVATPSSVLCEHALFETVGGFDPALSQCADWDMWVRLAMLTEFLYVDEPLVTYRQHDMNMSCNVPLLEYDSLRVLDKGFAMPGLPDALRIRRRAALARNYTVLAGSYFHARRYRDFIRCAARAVALDTHQICYLAAFPARVAFRRQRHHLAKTG